MTDTNNEYDEEYTGGGNPPKPTEAPTQPPSPPPGE